MSVRSFVTLLVACGMLNSLRADDAQALAAWKSGAPPFSFTYNGKSSTQFLGTWRKKMDPLPSAGGQAFRYMWADPDTSLMVIADVRVFDKSPAIDWVLHFTNAGDKDTPVIENVKPLDWTMPASTAHPILNFAQGSNASGDDFMPHSSGLDANQSAQLNSEGGRSSNHNLPFFNLQDGDHGLIGAIGWTGNWVAKFNAAADGKSIAMNAGMRATHFILHPGETVRTPRIVLFDWKGGTLTSAQNLWRQFVLSFYSPTDDKGKLVQVPLAFGQGNDTAIGPVLHVIQVLHDMQVPIDAFWIDASWYGDGKGWVADRGNWYPDKHPYPNGLKPVGDALAADGFGFILWIEAEAAMNGSKFMTEHPTWYLHNGDPTAQGLLDLGNPEARQGMTDFVTKNFKEWGVTWYRQDFNVDPEGFWSHTDTPDRAGIAEMKDIEGLYLYWDAIRAAGFQIDNCASGGRRLDIETISRSVALFRTDHSCNFFDPLDNQRLTQGLNIWLPLNSGVYAGTARDTPDSGASQIYAVRSSFSSGWLVGTDRLVMDAIKPGAVEFKEIRDFFLGDFYPLTSYNADKSSWSVQQWHRPDQKAGIVLGFRRQDSMQDKMKPGLQALDPVASYSVEVRTGYDKTDAKTISGGDLANLELTISDKPGSVLVLYKQQ